MPATFATATHTGLVRRSNEDSLFARAPVFVVADGMGGAQAGEVASGMATKAFEWFLPQTQEPEAELIRVITRVNAGIHELALSDSSRAGMGTTLTAAVVRGPSVSIAHVGDSRAYLWRDGALTQLTDDHSLVGEMLRSGQITSAEADEHPQRSIITRALGVDPEVQIDSISIAWQPGDIFLLCSDGLYGMVDDNAIASVLAGGDNLYVSAWKLVEAANAGGGRDNISVVLFNPDGSIDPGVEQVHSMQTSAMVQPSAIDAGSAEPEMETTPRPRGWLASMRWWLSTIPGRIVIGLALAIFLLGGAWYISRQFYYIGVEGDRVVIYQGVPYNLGPWSLSSLYRSSPVKFNEMEPFEQERVSRQELLDKSDAEKTLENYNAAAKERQLEVQRRAAEEAARAAASSSGSPIPQGGLP